VHPEVSKARARVAGLTRCVKNGERPAAELADAKRELAEAKQTAYVEEILAAAPKFTDEQRTKLAELLRPSRRPASEALAAAGAE
jgi:hypothetical protein